jgi:hypothetical protein
MYVAPRALTYRTLHSAHRVHLCVLYGSHNKQQLFAEIALTGWSF